MFQNKLPIEVEIKGDSVRAEAINTIAVCYKCSWDRCLPAKVSLLVV